MVSVANEVKCFHLEKKKEASSFSKSPVVGGLLHEPSLYDVISYSYCYVGIMTGRFICVCVLCAICCVGPGQCELFN